MSAIAVCLLMLTVGLTPIGGAGSTAESGVLAGGTFGLHGAAVHPARAEHPVDVTPGVTGIRAWVTSSDALGFGAPELRLHDPLGEFVVRAPAGPMPTIDVGWSTIDARGLGTYTLVVDCGLCSVATYELHTVVRTTASGVNASAEQRRLLIEPGATIQAPFEALNTGAAGTSVSASIDGLPADWGVAILYVGGTWADPGEVVTGKVFLTAPAVLADGTHVPFQLVLSNAEGDEDRLSMVVAYDTTIEALRDRSYVVVALIDTGINPYHQEFRGPGSFGVHPAWFIDDYPDDGATLELTLDAPDYDTAKAADAATWADVSGSTLYHVPGTRIAGAMCFGGCSPLDEGGHGTGTASLVGGATLGEAPEALIVALNGDLFAAGRWVARQSWIDVISMSLGAWAGGPTVGVDTPGVPASGGTGNPYVPFSTPAAQKAAWESGKRWFTGSAQGWGAWWDTSGFDGGEGLAQGSVSGPAPNTWLSPLCGSPWTFVVEAYWPWNEQTWRTQGFPPDVVAQGWDLTAASASTLTGTNTFGHTSGATPQAAGLYARVVHEGRIVLGSTQEGAAEGVLATAAPGASLPSMGPAADGVLTVDEAQAVYLHSLEQVDIVESIDEHGLENGRYDENTMPTVPAGEYPTQGYGLVTDEARALALDVVRGDAVEPFRPEDDAAYLATFAARLAIWEPHVQGEVWVF